MSITVKSKDGQNFSFPDGTDPTVIQKAVQGHYARAAQAATVQKVAQAQQPIAPVATPVSSKEKEALEEESTAKKTWDAATGTFKAVGGFMQAGGKGITMGGGDLLNAGVYTAGKKLMGDERPMGTIFDEEIAGEREKAAEFAEEHAALSAGAEITGSILSPVAKALSAFKVVKAGSKLAPTVNAGAQGVAGAVPYVFLSTEGTVTERLDEAASVAVPAALFGVVGSKAMSVGKDAGGAVLNYSKNTFNKVFRKVSSTPLTTESLKQSKNAAYQLVKDNDIRFSKSSIQSAYRSFSDKVVSNKSFSPDDKQSVAVVKLFNELSERKGGKGLELSDLDKIQQSMWRRYKTAKATDNGSEQSVILDAIDSVDDLIAKHPSSHEAMSAARLANRRFKKAESFDRIADKIKNTEAFKGKNPVEQTKLAVAKILDDERAIKYFDATEVSRFKEFIADSGTQTQEVLSKIGKMSMTGRVSYMLHIGLAAGGGAATGGISLVPQAALAAGIGVAKKYAQSKQQGRTNAFQSEMKGNPRAPSNAGVSGAQTSGAFSLANEVTNEDERQRQLRRSAR
jgi:hypothetical protein